MLRISHEDGGETILRESDGSSLAICIEFMKDLPDRDLYEYRGESTEQLIRMAEVPVHTFYDMGDNSYWFAPAESGCNPEELQIVCDAAKTLQDVVFAEEIAEGRMTVKIMGVIGDYDIPDSGDASFSYPLEEFLTRVEYCEPKRSHADLSGVKGFL